MSRILARAGNRIDGALRRAGRWTVQKLRPTLDQSKIISEFLDNFSGILTNNTQSLINPLQNLQEMTLSQEHIRAFKKLGKVLNDGLIDGRDYKGTVEERDFKQPKLTQRYFSKIATLARELISEDDIQPILKHSNEGCFFELTTKYDRRVSDQDMDVMNRQTTRKYGIIYYNFKTDPNGNGHGNSSDVYRAAARPLQDVTRVESTNELIERIGARFRTIEGARFIYQGEETTIDSYEIAETPFTIRQMVRLKAEKGDEVRAIFTAVKDGVLWDIDRVISESRKRAARSVPEDQIDDCPLVYVSQKEAEAVAKLAEARLLTEQEWERAASGTNGLNRPWEGAPGEDTLSSDRAVYDDSGTRPVKSKPAGKSKEKVYDLIGLVWEWTSSLYDSEENDRVLRGGSWGDHYPDFLRADYRGSDPPHLHLDSYSFRLARTKS
jgi:hypothetical protein